MMFIPWGKVDQEDNYPMCRCDMCMRLLEK